MGDTDPRFNKRNLGMKKEMKLVNNKGFCFSRKKTKKRGFASERKVRVKFV